MFRVFRGHHSDAIASGFHVLPHAAAPIRSPLPGKDAMTSEFERVILIAAHPDDAEFGMAGTPAKFARSGAEVVYVICTDGNKGTSDRTINTVAVAEVR